MTVGARLKGWMKLPPGDRPRLLLMTMGLPLVSLALASLGYKRTLHGIQRLSPGAGTRATTADDIGHAQRLAELAWLAGTYGPVRATCLRQSLLTYLCLRRRGLAPQLRLGARHQEGRFDAHAWVELDGHALGQKDLQHSPFEPRTS